MPVHNGLSGGWWFNRCVHIYFLTISSYNYIRAINLNDHWPSLALMEIKSDQQTVPDIKVCDSSDSAGYIGLTQYFTPFSYVTAS